MKQKTIKFLSWAVILAAVFLLVWTSIADRATESNIVTSDDESKQKQIWLNVYLADGQQKNLVFDYRPSSAIFDLLKQAEAAGQLTIKYRDFGGQLGIFLETIDGVGDDGNKWWQYWVNGEYGQVEVSSYFVEAGDLIEFRYEGEGNEQ